jgi:hypothetical protein
MPGCAASTRLVIMSVGSSKKLHLDNSVVLSEDYKSFLGTCSTRGMYRKRSLGFAEAQLCDVPSDEGEQL